MKRDYGILILLLISLFVLARFRQTTHSGRVKHPGQSESVDLKPGYYRLLGRRIPINSADRELLEALPGVGPALAERIIRYREQQGPFQGAEDLRRVPGIGDRLVARLEPLISYDAP